MAPDNIPNRELYYLGTPKGTVSGQAGTGSIDGVPLFIDGKVQTVDEKEIKRKARELAKEAVRRAGLNDESVPTTTTLYDAGN